jgi:hypothetical protein
MNSVLAEKLHDDSLPTENDKMVSISADRRKMDDHWARETSKQIHIEITYSPLLEQ